MIDRPQGARIIAGSIVFVMGACVYLFDRSGSSVYVVPAWWTIADATPAIFGALGDYLPTFAHVFAFTLFTAAVLSPGTLASIVICAAWFSIDLSFELAQIDAAALEIVRLVPAWFSDWPILENTADYFLAGHFDPLDVASIALGSVAAGLVLFITTQYGTNNVTQQN